MKFVSRLVVAGVVAALALVAGELVLRRLDGFVVLSAKLRPARPLAAAPAPPDDERPDRRAVASVPLADGVEAGWYESDADPIPRFPEDPMVLGRLQEYPNDPIGALLVWNPIYVRREVCAGNTAGSLGILDEFLVFEPADDSGFPIFRHLPNASPPSWFTSNAFGWRGPPLSLVKPADTIRIAFVGASTTIAVHGYAASHPEHIGHWLNLWAQAKRLPQRFEVINAGRTGIDSASIEAIVRQEVEPIDPDLVVYYEGANQFAPGKLMRMPPQLAVKPGVTFRQRSPLEDYSVTARRTLTALDIANGGNGYEPPKPNYPITWPRGIDHEAPDVTRKPLPMDLDAVVANLDRMRASLAGIGAELGVSSFLWMVYPGMQLDMTRDLGVYRFLNDTYWPATYAHMRRAADFQNNLFASYARRYDLPFFDIAAAFPRDPALFGDSIHLRQPGLRLQGWIYLQQLVPLIKQRLESGRWPRRRTSPPLRNPADYGTRLLKRRDILSSCPR